MNNDNIQPPTDDIEAPEPNLEDFLPAAPKPRSYLQRKPSIKSLNPALILFILCIAASSFHWTHDSSKLWVSYNSIYIDKEYWRLLSTLFTHADSIHLLSNSMLFLIFGWILHDFFGFLAFPVISTLTGVVTAFITMHFHDPQARMLGASGMIYAMVAMWIVLYVTYEKNYSVPMRFLRTIGFSLAMLFPTSFQIETDYIAHAIGFAVGIFAGLALIPLSRKDVVAFYAQQNRPTLNIPVENSPAF